MTNAQIALLAAGGLGLLYLSTRSPTPTPPPSPTLDANLTGVEKQSVLTALSIERNPANLRSFADSLEGISPVAASMLKARASMLRSV